MFGNKFNQNLSKGYGEKIILLKCQPEKKLQLQILEYASFSPFNIITHICDIFKRITGNDERTKRYFILYDDFKMTGNSVNSFNNIKNKSFNNECSRYKISSFNKEFMKQI